MHITVHCGTPVGRGIFVAAKQVLISEDIDPSHLDRETGVADTASQADISVK